MSIMLHCNKKLFKNVNAFCIMCQYILSKIISSKVFLPLTGLIKPHLTLGKKLFSQVYFSEINLCFTLLRNCGERMYLFERVALVLSSA